MCCNNNTKFFIVNILYIFIIDILCNYNVLIHPELNVDKYTNYSNKSENYKLVAGLVYPLVNLVLLRQEV